MISEEKLIEILRVMKQGLLEQLYSKKDRRTLWVDGLYDAVAAIHELLEYNSLYIANNLFSKDTINKIENILKEGV